MYRTNTCGELRITDAGKEITLAGWVQTVRKLGAAITFVDLRDRYGITQLLFGEGLNKQLEENPLGREFVLQVTGTVSERSSKNANIPTGDIEINVSSFKILNKSAVPPFTIQDDTDGGDDLRMTECIGNKYSFLVKMPDVFIDQVKINPAIHHAKTICILCTGIESKRIMPEIILFSRAKLVHRHFIQQIVLDQKIPMLYFAAFRILK